MPVTYEVAKKFINKLRKDNPNLNIQIAGSFRRGRPLLKDIDILIISKTPKWPASASPIDALTLNNIINQNAGDVHRMVDVRFENKTIKCDITAVNKKELPFTLFHLTGDKGENMGMRLHAIEKGWLLNQYGLFDRDTKKPVKGSEKITSEKKLYEFFGKKYKKPEDRNTTKLKSKEAI